ncbi:MAG: manganese efflux pump MntP family protein [Termitinemataceae bacterium]
MLQTLLIALGLSMDAFAVSVSSALCASPLESRYILRGSLAFGIFQCIMPIIGWFLGTYTRSYIQMFDHWVAFGLLAFIGLKMIHEALVPEPTACEDDEPSQSLKKTDIRNSYTLLTLAVATSIDALAVGFSYSILGKAIWAPSVVIGTITFCISLLGFEFGKRIGFLLEKRAELLGGLVLVGIGIKILAEHLIGS